MPFVDQRTDIVAPRVYNRYTDAKTRKNYIVMEYIKVETL